MHRHFQGMHPIDPNLEKRVDQWLAKNQPPDLSSGPAATIAIHVERNDGSSADVSIQIKKPYANGSAKHYVFRHRWAINGSKWVFRPYIRDINLAEEIETSAVKVQ